MPTTEPCLMIEMRDNRRIFTERQHLMALLEFARTFNARISLVAADGVELVPLEAFPAVVCNGAYRSPGTHTHLEGLLPRETIFTAARPARGHRPRHDTLTLAQAIRGAIRTAFLGHQAVSLRGLREKYREHSLSVSCLSGHLALVRRQMVSEGFAIARLGQGTYRIPQGGAR